jgi:hypothetical protein
MVIQLIFPVTAGRGHAVRVEFLVRLLVGPYHASALSLRAECIQSANPGARVIMCKSPGGQSGHGCWVAVSTRVATESCPAVALMLRPREKTTSWGGFLGLFNPETQVSETGLDSQ